MKITRYIPLLFAVVLAAVLCMNGCAPVPSNPSGCPSSSSSSMWESGSSSSSSSPSSSSSSEPEFPPERRMRGIDVSVYQGEINFRQVYESGIEVVYIRASIGLSRDARFTENYVNAKAQGLYVGYYHYLTARTVQQARQQAEFFAQTVQNAEPDCRLAMDFESFGNLNSAQINEIARVFLETLASESGREVLLYSDVYNLEHTFDSSLTVYPLWVAEYGVEEPRSLGAWTQWVGFQYGTGRVDGVSTAVDMDVFTTGVLLEE